MIKYYDLDCELYLFFYSIYSRVARKSSDHPLRASSLRTDDLPDPNNDDVEADESLWPEAGLSLFWPN